TYQIAQPTYIQCVLRNSCEQSSSDRTGLRSAARLSGQHIAPPLQPDFSCQRGARSFPHAGDLEIEGVERKQPGAMLRRREQRGKKAIPVARANLRLAVRKCILHRSPGPTSPLSCPALCGASSNP